MDIGGHLTPSITKSASMACAVTKSSAGPDLPDGDLCNARNLIIADLVLYGRSACSYGTREFDAGRPLRPLFCMSGNHCSNGITSSAAQIGDKAQASIESRLGQRRLQLPAWLSRCRYSQADWVWDAFLWEYPSGLFAPPIRSCARHCRKP